MLTFTEFSGSPYHIGLALGKFGATAVHDTLVGSPLWDDVMQWRGSDPVQIMQQRVQELHPYIWDELQGLARGIELPAEDVFLWNCRADLSPLAAQESATVMTLTPEGPRMVHYEGGTTDIEQHCGVAEFTVDHGPSFAALICPGSIPGHAASVTDKGLAITVNAVPNPTLTDGLPGMVLTRALLNTPDLSSAIQLLHESPRAGTLHLGMMQAGGSALLSIETSPTEVSIQPATDVVPQAEDNGHILADSLWATADMQAHTDALHWDVYEHPDEPARFRMQNAKHI